MLLLYIGTVKVKEGLAQMLKGGIIMDVVSAGQARIAEEAGACAVMALERVPADIRKDGGVARMTDPQVCTERGGEREGGRDREGGEGGERRMEKGRNSEGGERDSMREREKGEWER